MHEVTCDKTEIRNPYSFGAYILEGRIDKQNKLSGVGSVLISDKYYREQSSRGREGEVQGAVGLNCMVREDL